MADKDSRRSFIDIQRADAQRHFDETAGAYDARYGELDSTLLACLNELLAATAPGDELLDAACGTGRAFGLVTGAGRRLLGIDQSAEMLAVARAKWPQVPTRQLALQDLREADDLHGRFGGLMCVGALEWVLRDDWPVVLEGFRSVLRPGSPAYLDVEIPGEHEHAAVVGPGPAGAVAGEILVHKRVNHFPSRESVTTWLSDAGFAIVSERTGDYYWHLLVTAPG